MVALCVETANSGALGGGVGWRSQRGSFSPRPVGSRKLPDETWDINIQLVTAKYNTEKGNREDEWGDEPPAPPPSAPMAEDDEDEGSVFKCTFRH